METMLLAGTAAATGGTALPWLSTAGSIGSMVSNVGVGSLLSTGMTAFSAFGQISAGSQQNAIAKAQARQYELAARQEELKGREQADNIRRSLQASLASQRAMFGARGISLNSGTVRGLASESMTAAARDIEIARFGAGQNADALRGQAYQSRIEGRAGRVAGYTGAAKTLSSLVM